MRCRLERYGFIAKRQQLCASLNSSSQTNFLTPQVRPRPLPSTNPQARMNTSIHASAGLAENKVTARPTNDNNKTGSLQYFRNNFKTVPCPLNPYYLNEKCSHLSSVGLVCL